MSPPLFRFAPSPNGPLHLGHALAALIAWRAAASVGGRFLLRIEDIDGTRCHPRFEAAIYRDLAWLGLDWERPVRRQSEHFADYRAALARLAEAGLLYRCYASRSEIAAAIRRHETASGRPWPRDPDNVPHRPPDVLSAKETERRARAGAPFALRLDMKAAMARLDGPLFWLETGGGPNCERGEITADPAAWGDVVLARKDFPASYHLAVVVDDAAQGISHVVRGRDLFHSTGLHRLLQRLLGFPAPLYHHHRLLLDEAGRKLSKSRQDTALAELRRAGMTARDIIRRLGLHE